jgi:hypothetical protein
MRWARHAAYMGHNRSSDKMLLQKHEGKKPLGSSRCRWQHNIEMNPKETKCEGMD